MSGIIFSFTSSVVLIAGASQRKLSILAMETKGTVGDTLSQVIFSSSGRIDNIVTD